MLLSLEMYIFNYNPFRFKFHDSFVYSSAVDRLAVTEQGKEKQQSMLAE